MQKKSLAENGKDIKHSKTPTELFALYDKYIKSREVATEDVYYFLIKTSFFVKTGQIKFSVAQFLKKRAEIAETIDKVILADHDFWQENSEKKCAVLISALVNLKIDNALIEEKILNIVDNLAESSFPGLLHLINEYLPKNNQNNKNNILILLKDRAIKKLKENKKDSGADVFLPALLFLINNNYYDRKFLSEGELKKRIQKMSAAEFNSLTKVIFFNKTAQPYFFIDSLWQYIEDNFNKMP